MDYKEPLFLCLLPSHLSLKFWCGTYKNVEKKLDLSEIPEKKEKLSKNFFEEGFSHDVDEKYSCTSVQFFVPAKKKEKVICSNLEEPVTKIKTKQFKFNFQVTIPQ